MFYRLAGSMGVQLFGIAELRQMEFLEGRSFGSTSQPPVHLLLGVSLVYRAHMSYAKAKNNMELEKKQNPYLSKTAIQMTLFRTFY